jgi:hypothetical protein
MHQSQPSVNWATASQRMDDRRNAAANYRLARSAQSLPRARSFSDWIAGLKRQVAAFRDSLGQGLIALGERISADGPDPLSEM